MNARPTLKIAVVGFALLLTGCGTLIPKQVELFQKKVKPVPQLTVAQVEVQREAAWQAKAKTAETVEAALAEKSSPAVLAPARDAEKLTDAVAVSLGPPVSLATAPATNTAERLLAAVGKVDKKLDAYTEKNEKLEGKKIEGTGLFQVPYLLWVAGIAAILFIVHLVLKTVLRAAAIANPGAAAGLAGMNVADAVIKKGFSQVLSGAEAFKNRVRTDFPDVADEVLQVFRAEQERKQDQDVQAVVKQVTNK